MPTENEQPDDHLQPAASDRERTKIAGFEPLVGSTIRGSGGILIGSVLIAIAGFFAWVAYGDLPSSVERPNVSPEMFTAIGVCFFGLPGVYLMLVGLRDCLKQARVEQSKQHFPAEPWRWDHRWQLDGADDINRRHIAGGLGGLVLALAIIVPLNYFAWTKFDAMMPKVIVSIFNIILLICIGTAVYRITAELRHGRSRVQYDRFPLRLSQPATLTLRSEYLPSDLRSLKCTLRCVEEQYQAQRVASAGAGSNRNTTQVTTVGYLRFHDERVLSGAQFNPGNDLQLTFALPDDAQLRTRLSELPPLYWELVLHGDRPGVDYFKRFLLPIY